MPDYTYSLTHKDNTQKKNSKSTQIIHSNNTQTIQKQYTDYTVGGSLQGSSARRR